MILCREMGSGVVDDDFKKQTMATTKERDLGARTYSKDWV